LAQGLQAMLQCNGRLGSDQFAVNKANQSHNPREQVRFEGDSAAGGKRARDKSREPGRYMRQKCCMLSAHLMLLLIHFSFSLADKLP
jgi:hypothetical protein